jgi:hypothetical protein
MIILIGVGPDGGAAIDIKAAVTPSELKNCLLSNRSPGHKIGDPPLCPYLI